MVTHTARLPGITDPVTATEVLDDRRMAQRLAAQPQLTDPRAGRTYHALTFGWLCGELVRRIDGRSVSHFFSDEVAEPLGLEIYIGLPRRLEQRVARLVLSDKWAMNPVYNTTGAEHDELLRTVWGNPALFAPETFPWNDRSYHEAQIPGVNAIGTARSIANLYGRLDTLVSPETLRLACSEIERRHEPLINAQQAFAVGFMLQTDLHPLGPPRDAFGHGGAGGSAHGAWPSHRVGFSYVMNLMCDYPEVDPRADALLHALFHCVTARERAE